MPTRSDPAAPALSASRSARAASRRATIALGVPEQELAGLRQRHGPRAARALDEPLPDEALEGGDLLADGRLRVAEPLRRAAERALVRDGLEGREMPQFDAEPTIRFHDRHHRIPDLRLSLRLTQTGRGDAFFVIAFLLLVGPLAVICGADSRRDEPHRPW